MEYCLFKEIKGFFLFNIMDIDFKVELYGVLLLEVGFDIV